MKKLVSIILAIKNEETHIEKCIDSLCRQNQKDFSLEILLVDGMSTDKTREIIQSRLISDPRIKLVDNVKGIAPAAFNEGLKKAMGDYICIFGAHAEYDHDYIKTCINEIKLKNADACSGKIVLKSAKEDSESELILSIFNSKIGVSSGSFRTLASGYVESIPYGVFKKEVFEKVGFYNERLIRNQDNDMNSRIIKLGFKLYLTDLTSAIYYPKDSFLNTLKYAYNTGLWNAFSLRLGSFTLRLFHFVPFAFLIYMATLLVILFSSIANEAKLLISIPSMIYMGLLLSQLMKFNFKHKINYIYFPFLVLLFHLSYGTGTMLGFFKKIKI